MTIINTKTFTATATTKYRVEGTVEVTLHGETRRVNAWLDGDEITAFGMTGRYQTGARAWPAMVTAVTDPTTGKVWDRIHFGRNDQSGKFRKTSNLFFAE